jgi:hypothetical protein
VSVKTNTAAVAPTPGPPPSRGQACQRRMDPQTSVAVALLLLLAYGTGVEARARHKVGLGFGVVVGLLLLAACTFYEASQVSELLPSQVCHPSRSPLVGFWSSLVDFNSTPSRCGIRRCAVCLVWTWFIVDAMAFDLRCCAGCSACRPRPPPPPSHTSQPIQPSYQPSPPP